MKSKLTDHQCRAHVLRRIKEHAALRITDQAAYDATMAHLMREYLRYDGYIVARAQAIVAARG